MEIATAVGMAVGVSVLLTFGITRLWDAHRMEKKFVTKEQCEVCMENLARRAKEQKEFREKLNRTLEMINARLMLGNLIMADLCENAKIPNSKIESYEKALGIKLRDKDSDG